MLFNFLNKIFFITCFIFLFTPTIICQLLSETQIDTCKIYTSLDEALLTPNKVRVLDLSRQKLHIFPKEIIKLKNLQSLKLIKNKLDSIPANISSLKYLQYLNLSKNKLESFPAGVAELSNLKSLIINQNYIKSIPFNIKNLHSLEYLDMWSNDLSEVSENIKYLTNLKELDLRVIMLSNKEKDRIQRLLPNTKVFFSNSCNCGY